MKPRIYFFSLMLLFSSLAINTQAASGTRTKGKTEVRRMQIKQRVDQIRTMDLSHLDRIERTCLKTELKSMNKELRTIDPVGYITGGVLVIIITIIMVLL